MLLFRFDASRCEFTLSLHASDLAAAEQTLTVAADAIESTLTGFYGGYADLVERLLVCSHCLSTDGRASAGVYTVDPVKERSTYLT